jgi:hypothetical protein
MRYIVVRMEGAHGHQSFFDMCMLGNKWAKQHNLETVHFREKLASGNFLAWSSSVCVFFCRAMVGVTPYKVFLKVPWVNKQLASSDFTFRKR